MELFALRPRCAHVFEHITSPWPQEMKQVVVATTRNLVHGHRSSLVSSCWSQDWWKRFQASRVLVWVSVWLIWPWGSVLQQVPQWLRQQGEFNQICLNLGRLTLRAPDFQRFQFFDCCFPRPREFGDRLSRHRPDANHVTPLCSTVDVVPTWTFRVQNQGANGASVKRILHPRSPKTSTSMQ